MSHEEAALAQRVGEAIKRRRQACGWSQAVLAEKVEVSAHYLGALERGIRLPAVPVLVRLASALGASADELLGLPVSGDRWVHDAGDVLNEVPEEARPWAMRMLKGLLLPPSRLGLKKRAQESLRSTRASESIGW